MSSLTYSIEGSEVVTQICTATYDGGLDGTAIEAVTLTGSNLLLDRSRFIRTAR